MTLIDNFKTDEITIKRYDTGAYNNGVYVPGAITEFTVNAVVMPLTGKELLNLPEAQRTKRALRVYTDIQLVTADDVNNKKADRFDHQEREYEIQKNEDWTRTDIEHYKSIAIEVDSYEGDRK